MAKIAKLCFIEIIGRLSHVSSQLCGVKSYFLFNTINSLLA